MFKLNVILNVMSTVSSNLVRLCCVKQRGKKTFNDDSFSEVSNQFLASDSIAYAVARYMLSPVRLSVCPSVTRVYHTRTFEARIMYFSPYGSPVTLVFAVKFRP